MRIAALITAFRGESARVETLVAIELAVSWKPFVKSKKSATATTAQRVSVHLGAPPGDARRALARDHAAPETTLALAKATSLGRGRVRSPGLVLATQDSRWHRRAKHYAFLTTMFAITLAARSAASIARSRPS